MNLSHLRATLWLRWRILVNRIRRAGKLGNWLLGLVLVVAISASIGFFLLALVIGTKMLPDAQPVHLMYVWGGLALAFLFSWMIGLVTDLQRSDAMSFKNLLHLPVSLGWVFLYNYLSSFVSLSVAIFLPAAMGLCIAMVITKGPLMLLSFPLVLGFFVMITALTYQLRGWLAHLMEDKRRGRNIVAVITVGFILLLQLPNLINLSVNTGRSEERQHYRELQWAAILDGEDQDLAQEKLAEYELEKEETKKEIGRNLMLGATIIPLGWLPIGMRATFEGRLIPGSMCALGMLLIGAWSLRRSYRTTMLSVVGGGQVGAAPDPKVAKLVPETKSGERKDLMVERSLPFVGDVVAGIGLAGLRSLLRAPEAKMLLLSPVILLGIFGFMLAKNPMLGNQAWAAPGMVLGAITMGLLSIVQLIQNQFGLDRAGFRAYLLSPVPRAKILLGKNLAIAPIGIGVGLIALLGLQFFLPSDLGHFMAACMQLVSAYLLLCLIGNMISIYGPMRLKEHGMKAANSKFKTVLWQILSLFLIPLTFSPLLIPWGVEFLCDFKDWLEWLPIYFVLHALGMVVVYMFYRFMVSRQGLLLQEREQHVLDMLTRD